MPYLKVHHIFWTLMVLSGLIAFVLPQHPVQAHAPSLELLFAPVSRPSGMIARWLHDKFAPELSADQRAAEVVKEENRTLRDELASLHQRLESIRQLEEYRKEIGDIRPLCTPFAVAGSDTGTRQTLAIQGSSLQGIRDGMAVLCPGGIVGQVARSGLAGARVQLVTDAGFRVRASFARFEAGKFRRIADLETVMEGTGRGAMTSRGLTREAVKLAGLKVGDAVLLSEPNWPSYLQGRYLGRIVTIGAQTDAPLFALITAEPTQNLMRLTEVMIVTKAPAGSE